jgi:hypothetical protein
MNQCREANGEEVVEEGSCLLGAIWDAGRLARCLRAKRVFTGGSMEFLFIRLCFYLFIFTD